MISNHDPKSSPLQIGFKVNCRDGWIGTLKRLVVNPISGRVTHLVVEALSPASKLMVPAEYCEVIGYEAVFLNLTLAQLKRYYVHAS